MGDKISNELYESLQKLNRYIHRNRHRAIESNEGIHPGQMRLLMLISKNEGIMQRGLTEILDMRPSSITEMISNLEKNSLIRREQDENDRRVMHVYLTENGKKITDEFNKTKDSLPDMIFSSLSLEEKDKMLEIINKINSNLENLDTTDKDIDYRSKNNGKFCSHHKHGRHHRKNKED